MADPTPSRGKRRLVLVGNAPLDNDHTQLVDSADVVVRCNEAKTLGQRSGTRTDVLCVCNTGAPAARIIAERSIQRIPRFPSLSEVWFPRHSPTHLRHIRESNFPAPEAEYLDRTEDIMAANGLEEVVVSRLSQAFNERVFGYLRRKSPTGFACPSTGFLALCHILEVRQYSPLDKLLIGFTFKMWWGHPARAERRFVERLCEARTDVHWIR